MADLKNKPHAHNHKDFLAKAKERSGFTETYEALDLEFTRAEQMIKARAKAGLTQGAGEFGVETCVLSSNVKVARPRQ
jgi:hypothetical protein